MSKDFKDLPNLNRFERRILIRDVIIAALLITLFILSAINGELRFELQQAKFH